MIIAGTVGTLVHIFSPFRTWSTYALAKSLGFLGTKIMGLDIDVVDRQRVASVGPCIYVSNHQSNEDLLVCCEVIGRRTVSIGKKSLRFIPFFGPLYWLIGNILIDRKNIRKSVKELNDATDKTLHEKKTSIWIFPEGTRNTTPMLLPFKRGAFRIAIKSRVPVVPICVNTYPGTLNFNRWRSGRIKVTVLEPILTDNLKTGDAAALAESCQESVQAVLDSMNAEMNPEIAAQRNRNPKPMESRSLA
jgi:1-acyl-sn-glycerol-3-phosphate acyltransferase